MRKVLVTGGAGFVGSNLVKKLLREWDCEVTVLDDFFTGTRGNLDECDVEIVEGSVTNSELVESLAQGKDIIFHLAARNLIVSSCRPREDLDVNAIGTFNVLEAARKHGVGRLVYTSTSSVYGNPRHIPINEDEVPKFLSFYSASKYAGESYANVFYEMHAVPITILRYSNVYGLNQLPRNPYCGVIGKFISAALKGEPLCIHGDGEQTRDYTYIDDACEATVLAALNPKALGESYNVGTEVETSVNRLAQLIIGICGSSSEITYVDKRDIDNIRRRSLSISKIRSHLRFSPKFTMEKGLRRTIEGFSPASRTQSSSPRAVSESAKASAEPSLLPPGTVLTGEYVRLRPLTADDAALTLAWRQRDKSTLLRKGAETEAEQRAWILVRPASELNFIIETVGGVPLGTLALVNIEMQNRRSEAGRFLIGEKLLARGIPAAVEAMKLLYELAFETLGLTRIYGTVVGNHPRMLKWQKYLGMQEEGRLRQQYYLDGQYIDAISLGLLVEEFRTVTRPRMQALIAAARVSRRECVDRKGR